MSVLTRPDGSEPEDFHLSRRLLGGLFFSGYATAALAQSAQPVTTPEDGLTTGTVTYPAPDGFQTPAFVARPQGSGPFPVVIVVSEIFGVHEYIRDLCRRLAKAGYAAIAPALFVRIEDPAPLSDTQRIREIVNATPYEQVMGDIAGALDWVSGQLWANSEKVGITGFCWGGKLTWQATARFAAIDAGVAWYGGLAPSATATDVQRASGAPWPVDLAGALKGPVLGLYGGQDRGIPVEAVEAMRAALRREGAEGSDIHLYPDAPHGFHADYRASYRAETAADGWRRMLAHFDRYLKG